MSKGFSFSFMAASGWALTIILSKVAFMRGEDAYTLVFWTTLFATPFWVFMFVRNRSRSKPLSRLGVYVLLGMGLNGVILSFLEPLAIKHSTAVNYAFLIRSVLLFTILFASFYLHEKLTRKKIVLIVLTTAGAYLLTTNGQTIHLSLGDGLTLLEAFCIALGNNILGKISTKHMSPDAASTASFFVSVVPIALIALMMKAIVIPHSLLLFLCITACSIAVRFMRFRAYQHASASYVTMIFSFTPVFVTLMAYIFLNENLTFVQIVGGGLMVLSGVVAKKVHL